MKTNITTKDEFRGKTQSARTGKDRNEQGGLLRSKRRERPNAFCPQENYFPDPPVICPCTEDGHDDLGTTRNTETEKKEKNSARQETKKSGSALALWGE